MDISITLTSSENNCEAGIDSIACNFNLNATDDNGSCTYAETNYDCNGDCLNDIDGDVYVMEAEIEGCSDNGIEINGFGQVNDIDGDEIAAINYNPLATDDDGSCITEILGCSCRLGR